MSDKHFYVENTRLMSHGLSNLGSCEYSPIIITGKESIEELSGKLLGYGISKRTRGNLNLLEHYTEHEHPFVRRAAYFGVVMAGFLNQNMWSRRVLEKGYDDNDLEVRKASLIGNGLANLSRGDEQTCQKLDEHLNDEEWKIRAAVGLAYSTSMLGNPRHFHKFIDILKNEKSPYVKVCSCWYISTAFAGTKQGIDEYKELLSMKGDENSFFRDMACLGLGLSFLGEQNEKIDELILKRIREDPHPYVRESACFGLALNNFRKPNRTLYTTLETALKDESMIVRSGAALSFGIIDMGMRTIGTSTENIKDTSVKWGLSISKGLAKLPPEHEHISDNYVRWSNHLGDCFRDNLRVSGESLHVGVKEFQDEVNKGMLSSGLQEDNEIDSFRLSYPGLFHYLVYDSFWWGLWVLSAIGNTIKSLEDNLK